MYKVQVSWKEKDGWTDFCELDVKAGSRIQAENKAIKQCRRSGRRLLVVEAVYHKEN